MLSAYSTNITVAADAAIPFENIAVEKGCTAVLRSPATISLNKCGVYMVNAGVSSAASETIQLYKDGVAVPGAISTGLSPFFSTLVQVTESNGACACKAPTNIQVVATTAGTLTDARVTVTKIC